MSKFLRIFIVAAAMLTLMADGAWGEESKENSQDSASKDCWEEYYECGTKKDCRDVEIKPGYVTRVCAEVPIRCKKIVCKEKK
ncbi:hypothetical protein [Thermodesulfovibrio hydrogeniphilus]